LHLPGQDSNLDKESQNPNTPRHNSNSENILRSIDPVGCSAGCSDEQSEGGIDPDLARLIDAWPDLPPTVRRMILAALEARGPGE
jgi:hypothetical protein